jgi:hypothetical protein
MCVMINFFHFKSVFFFQNLGQDSSRLESPYFLGLKFSCVVYMNSTFLSGF